MGSSQELTAPQSTQQITATVHATPSRTDASIHLTLAVTPAQTQPSSATTVKFEPLDEPSSEVKITATLSLRAEPSFTVESPALVANGFKNDLNDEKAPSVKRSPSSASAKTLGAEQANSAGTPVKSALKEARVTSQNDETGLFPVLHEQLRSTSPVPVNSANIERESPVKSTFASPKSQSDPKTPTKPISHEEDELVSGFADLHVDRNKSHRTSNKLSQIPSPYSVRIQDPSGRATVYDNIHFPDAYVNKIQSQQPHLACTIQTSPSARPPTVSAEWKGTGSNEFDSDDDDKPVRYAVDRSMSSRPDRINTLTSTPSPNKVIVVHRNGVQLEYDNIHYPARYMDAIRRNNPGARCWVESQKF